MQECGVVANRIYEDMNMRAGSKTGDLEIDEEYGNLLEWLSPIYILAEAQPGFWTVSACLDA